MANITEYIPMYISQTVANVGKQVITAERWNELWNLNIIQGDYLSEMMVDVIDNVLADQETAATLRTEFDSHIGNLTAQQHVEIDAGLPEDPTLGSLFFQLGEEIVSEGGMA